MMQSKTAYPERGPFFMARFIRLMARVCLANEIGGDACYMLSVIVMTEDSKRYKGPVTFYNEQLMPLIGVNSEKRLCRLRDACVDAGWLCYQPGRKGVAGRYHVMVPSEYVGMTDKPLDEPADYAEYFVPHKSQGELQGNQLSDATCTPQIARTTAGEPQDKSALSQFVTVKPQGQSQDKWRPFLPTPNPLSLSDTPLPQQGGNSGVAITPEPGGQSQSETETIRPESIQVLVDEWKRLELPGHRTLTITSSIRGHWQQRLHDDTFRDRWREAVSRIRGSPWLMGTDDNAKWSGLTLPDFIRQPKWFEEIMNGKWDVKRPPPPAMDFPNGYVEREIKNLPRWEDRKKRQEAAS